jgi:hypothetical protein
MSFLLSFPLSLGWVFLSLMLSVLLSVVCAYGLLTGAELVDVGSAS